MPTTTASASLKKAEGTLKFTTSTNVLTWTPVSPPGSAPQLSVEVSSITNLQQTPAGSAKVALKVVIQPPGAAGPENHVFNFTSPAAARAEQEAVTDALRTAITTARDSGGSGAATPGPGPSNASPSKSGSGSAAAGDQAEELYAGQLLMDNVELQRSLLETDANLRRRFEKSFQEKPANMSSSQFSRQFWAARRHLLRLHAIERSQKRGIYNVLSGLKSTSVDGVQKLGVTKEQIHMIFEVHPIVKQAFAECVPRLSEVEFWSRFFMSRLFKTLKGERITENDPSDSILDRYINMEAAAAAAAAASRPKDDTPETHVPHFIDLQGNEQNNKWKGNQPDISMRPTAAEKASILEGFNTMSKRILSNVVALSEENPHAPIGMDEDRYHELRLRDLQAEHDEESFALKINQSHSFDRDGAVSNTPLQNPEEALAALQSINWQLNLPRVFQGHGNFLIPSQSAAGAN